MKKFLSFALALVMILSLGVVAFADSDAQKGTETKWDGIYTATAETTFKEIVKTYKSEDGVVVNEILTFTSSPSEKNPDYVKNADGSITAANLTVDPLSISDINFNVTSGDNAAYLKVKIPSLSKAGTYEWIIKENKGTTPGVTYVDDVEVHVLVLVEYDNLNHKLVIGNKPDETSGITSYIKKTDGSKSKTFENIFKSGSFSVAKDVTGNMSNENDQFLINVTLTSEYRPGTNVTLAGKIVTPDLWNEVKSDDGSIVTGYTYTSSEKYADLAGNDVKSFSDIPVGVTVTVSEPASYTDAEGNNVDNMGDYTYVSTELNNNTFTQLTVADTNTSDNTKIVVTNNNDKSITTGVSMDSIPYVVLLTVACLGLVVLFTKKRAARDF